MPEVTADKASRSVRALEIVEAVASADRPMAVVDLIGLTGLPKATLHRLCNLLEAEGYLRSDLSGRGYVGGHRLAKLARLTLATSAERSYRHGILTAVSHEIGETCNIVIPQGTEMFYSDRVETKWPLRHQLPIGSNVPVHCTASGKLYMSSLTKRQCADLVSVLSLERFTDNTITDPKNFLQALVKIRRDRIGIDDEEFVEGMVAVAVPICDDKGRMVAALAFHAPTVRMALSKAVTYLPVLQKAALALSADKHD
jgi:IclR family acetate operon transcriptional repressor